MKLSKPHKYGILFMTKQNNSRRNQSSRIQKEDRCRSLKNVRTPEASFAITYFLLSIFIHYLLLLDFACKKRGCARFAKSEGFDLFDLLVFTASLNYNQDEI